MGYYTSVAPPGQVFVAGYPGGAFDTTQAIGLGDGNILVQPFAVPISVTVDTAYIEVTVGGTGNWYIVLYADTATEGDHAPEAHLATSSAIDISSTGMLSGTFATPVALSADTVYWVGFYTDTSGTPQVTKWDPTTGASGHIGFMNHIGGTTVANGVVSPTAWSWRLTGQSSVPDPFTIGSASAYSFMVMIGLEQED